MWLMDHHSHEYHYRLLAMLFIKRFFFCLNTLLKPIHVCRSETIIGIKWLVLECVAAHFSPAVTGVFIIDHFNWAIFLFSFCVTKYAYEWHPTDCSTRFVKVIVINLVLCCTDRQTAQTDNMLDLWTLSDWGNFQKRFEHRAKSVMV